MEIGALIIIAIILFISWNFFRYADLPLVVLRKNFTDAEDSGAAVVNRTVAVSLSNARAHVILPATFR